MAVTYHSESMSTPTLAAWTWPVSVEKTPPPNNHKEKHQMDITSAFDPASFLDVTTTEVNERRQPLPVENPASPDGLYTAVIGTVTMKGGVKDGKPWLQAVVPLKIDVPQQIQESLKYSPQFTLTDRAFIDLTDQGLMDNAPGRNRRQKAYRDALGLNVKGEAFGWKMIEGKVVKIKISHRLWEGYPQEDIDAILKA